MMSRNGICPSCEGEGTVGEPCLERVCQRRGYHRIPTASYATYQGRPPDQVNPMVGRRIGDYLVVGFLGKGGFGTVYATLQLPILMPAAVKVVDLEGADDEMAETLAQKFIFEAQALAKLSHPNIVRLLQFGKHQGRAYMVMELIPGARTLKHEIIQMVRHDRDLERPVVAQILDQTCSALAAAHQQQIIHRDIKPENIMLQPVSGGYFVRLVDFGLVKFLEESTQSRFAMGTPMYMAPEQVSRKGVGPWTDLFAVAVIAFELLTGRRAFAGTTSAELLQAKLDPEYDACARLPPEKTTPGMRAFFKRALHPDPAHRYRDVSTFSEALKGMLRAVDEVSDATLMVDGLQALLDANEQRDACKRRGMSGHTYLCLSCKSFKGFLIHKRKSKKGLKLHNIYACGNKQIVKDIDTGELFCSKGKGRVCPLPLIPINMIGKMLYLYKNLYTVCPVCGCFFKYNGAQCAVGFYCGNCLSDGVFVTDLCCKFCNGKDNLSKVTVLIDGIRKKYMPLLRAQ